MKKIVLINPPIEDFYQTKIRHEPLGLEYVAAVLQNEGYDVHLLDALSEYTRQPIALPPQLAYIKEFYPSADLSPFKLFTRYQHFGLSFLEIENELKNLKPSCVGISANFTPYFDTALKIAQISKQTCPHVPVIMGGHHVTSVPESALRSEFVDYVVLGEGEFTFLKLIELLSQHELRQIKSLPGIAFKESSQIIINPPQHFIENLDSLPYPIPSKSIKHKMIITSRGCPRGCNFCAIDKVMGRRIRFRSVESVIEEIRFSIAQGFRQFDFEDDNLTHNKDRTIRLLNALITNFRSNHITFSAMNGLDAETLDEELIRLLKEAGFEWLNIPLVSGSHQIQKKLSRHQSKKKFQEVIKLANRFGLKVVAYLIIGLPEDNLEQMLDDIIFLAQQQVLLGPSIFYPPPGTPTYENCISKNYINHGDYLKLRSTAIPVETENFRRIDLITLFRLVRVINLVKNIIDRTLHKDQNFYCYLNQQTLKSDIMSFKYKLNSLQIGTLLLHRLFIKNELKGLKLKSRTDGNYDSEFINYLHSPLLVVSFLHSLEGKHIPGVQNKHAFIF